MKGHIRQRGKDRNTWSLQWYIGRDEITGNPRYGSATVHGSKRDAQAELHKRLHEINTGDQINATNLTLTEYFKEWLVAYAAPNVGAKTRERYEEILLKCIAPEIGHHQLSKLKPLHIQAYYSKALTSGRRDNGGALSPQTVGKYHRVLSKALKDAVRWRMIAKSPCDSVIPPKQVKKQAQYLNAEELKKLFAAIQGTAFEVPAFIAAMTGMRRGEVLALHWEDIDFERKVIHVKRSLEQTNNGTSEKGPKTPRSRRALDIPDALITELVKAREEQEKIKGLMGDGFQNEGYVCCQHNGRPYKPDPFSRNFARMIKAKELKPIPFHGLRHTMATALLLMGEHPKVVQERLGHASISTTLDTYSHVIPTMQKDAARKLDDFFGGLSPNTPKEPENTAE